MRMTTLCLALALGLLPALSAAAPVPPDSPTGIAFPEGYQDWRVIGVSHRHDNNTLRIILGNDQAIEAARAGETTPWPDGAILGKMVLKDTAHDAWDTALVPGAFVHAEFMVKDSARFQDTGGWGFARWLGRDLKVFGEDASFAQQCFACHTPMKDNDYVFTDPVVLP